MNERQPDIAETEASRRLAGLAAELGFEPTPEVRAARAATLEAMATHDPELIAQAFGAYQEQAELLASGLQGSDYAKAALGMSIDKALLWREAGNLDGYLIELEEVALIAADNYGLGDIAQTIQAACDEADQIERSVEPVSVVMSGNTLVVNGHVLQPDDGPELLQAALIRGHDEILQGLESFRRHTQELNPGAEVGIAPFTVMRLPGVPRQILTPASFIKFKKQHEQIVTDPTELREQYRPLWAAVAASGFRPDVRLYGTRSWNIGLWAKVSST